MLFDFPVNPHYTANGTYAYASVFPTSPLVFLKGTLFFRVPFTIFDDKEIEKWTLE